MRAEGGRRKAEGGTAALLTLAASAAVAADTTATAAVDRPAVRLSGSVRVTLTVDGPAPLRVDAAGVPDAASAEVWRVRPDGPPAVADLPGGRQRWSRAFRADPYQPGDPLRLGFAPARVADGADARPADVPVPPVDVRVTTDITDPAAATARPITGIEELPPVPATATDSVWPWVAGGAGTATAAATAWLVRRRRPPGSVSPEAAARQGLAAADALLAGGGPPAAVAERVAAAIRAFVAARYELPAERLTTTELAAAGAWPPDAGRELRAVLDACDRLRFADGPPDDPADLIRRAGGLVSLLAAPSGGPP